MKLYTTLLLTSSLLVFGTPTLAGSNDYFLSITNDGFIPQFDETDNIIQDRLDTHRSDVGFTTSEGTQFSLSQEIYTPSNRFVMPTEPNQRPYDGHLYGQIAGPLGNGFYASGRLGVMGDAALGKETQDIIHGLIGSPKFKEWETIQENEPLAGFSLMYVTKTIIEDLKFNLLGDIGTDRIAVSSTLDYNLVGDNYDTPNSFYVFSNNEPLGINVGITGNVVLYDASLERSDCCGVEPKPFVAEPYVSFNVDPLYFRASFCTETFKNDEENGQFLLKAGVKF